MKKIFFLSLHLNYGGIEKAITQQANIFSEKYDVTIYCVYKLTPKPAFYLNKNVKVIYLLSEVPNKKELLYSIEKRNFIQIVKNLLIAITIVFKKHVSIINVIKNIKDGTIISTRIEFTKKLSKYGNKKVLKIAEEHCHHNDNVRYINKLLKYCKNIDYLIPASNELTNFYNKKMTNRKTKCVYIPHFLEEFPKEKDLSNHSEKIFTAIGRLSGEKGFDDLIECFKLFNKENDEYILNIIGNGPEHKKLSDKIIKYGLSKKVFLHGFLNKEKVYSILQKTSIYLMTSYEESFGIVLIEAMSHGVPCIAFDSARGACEIIEDNSNGFLIKNRNYSDFVTKIKYLVENSERIDDFGKAARKKSLFYSREKSREKWFDILK